MPAHVGFFTAVKYGQGAKTRTQSVLETVDSYFYLGGKKAQVIAGKTKQGQEKALLSKADASLLARIAKVASYCTIVLPLAMLAAKALLRSTHSYRLIDPKKKLEKGININEDTVAKLQRLMPNIRGRKEDAEITWLATGNNLVFKLKDSPNLVFKMAKPGVSVIRDTKRLDAKAIGEERFSNMIQAKEVCLANHLGQLIIPHAKKFEVELDHAKYTLIAEEALDFDPNESAHEELYHKHAAELNETMRQLAAFVAQTGFNDVAWRNIPLLNEAPGFHGQRRVALIDLECMDSIENGFLGDNNGSCGLIRCVSEEQIDIVIDEARKQGVAISEDFQEAKATRLQELESDKKLRHMHERNGIVTGKELLHVDPNSLGLDLTEKAQFSVPVAFVKGEMKWEKHTVSLRQVTEEVIAEINKQIAVSAENASVKGKRYILLDTNEYPIKQYLQLGLPPEKLPTNKELKQLWLHRIIQALIDKGHLFELDKVNGHGYFIQA